jgi:hypothetical protein
MGGTTVAGNTSSTGGATAEGGASSAGGTVGSGNGTGGASALGGTSAGGRPGLGSGGAPGGLTGTGGGRTGGIISTGGVATGGLAGTGGAAGAGGLATGGVAATGGRTSLGGGMGAGGVTRTGGITSTGGVAALGGSPGTGGVTSTGGATTTSTAAKFSFFVTSIEAMRLHSGNQNGFGGDLRFGEAAGLAGADKLCRTIAEQSMAGAGAKGWVAFLSATTGGTGGGAVNAIDRVGSGPWYDRLGRTVALTKTDLAKTRPGNCATAVCNDLPNENGVPNNQGVDNHDTLTGSDASGKLASTSAGATCNDWTSSVGSTGKPTCGHSWPANSGQSWIQAHTAGGCAAGVNLVQNGAGTGTTVGSGGGYGGIYCFALQP